MTIAVRRLFNRSWSVLWATTYTYGVVGFDEYFIGQLRQDGVNVTVLADHGALSEMWADMREITGLSRLQRVNRDYLLRPVAWHGHAFHPKTYLFGNESGGKLIVGSGNADLGGLVAGYEMFASFTSEDPIGLAAIAQWREWMDRLVDLLDDQLVASRWQDAQGRLPWLRTLDNAGVLPPSPLILNLDRTIAEQYLEGIEAPVDELHVGAPFWDDRLAALRHLLDRTQPRRLDVYIGDGSRIDGLQLTHLIEERGLDARIWTYSEPRFVHAKLIACIAGRTGRVLSGSANLSWVALLGAKDAGNVEAGVIAEGDADRIRPLFTPVGLELVPLAKEDLAAFKPDDRIDEPSLPLRLLRAERLADGHLSLAISPVPIQPVFVVGVGPDRAAIGLVVVPSAGTPLYPELARARSAEAWESTVPLVEVVDIDGAQLSNPVPIDDPDALLLALKGRDQTDRGALVDLEWDELDTPVGHILEELQATCVFEPRRAQKKRNPLVDPEKIAEGDTSFWHRLGKLDLGTVEPRQRSRFGRGHLDSDPIFAQLRAMLVQAPYLPDLKAIRTVPNTDDDPDDPEAVKRRWTLETRQRVRIFNVLKRWCRAVRDPELLAIDPLLAMHNYRALLQALGELWLGDGEGGRYFTEEHLHQLLRMLLESLVGKAGSNKGVFEVADAPTRERMLLDLREHGATQAIADLLFDVLRPERVGRPAAALAWQGLLVPALGSGVVEPVSGPISDALRWASEYLDDEGWRRDIRDRFGIETRIVEEGLASGYKYMLLLTGVDDLVTDVRAVLVLQSALRRWPASGFVVGLADNPDRLSVQNGETAYARVNGQILSSERPISIQDVLELPDDQGLQVLLGLTSGAAATG